MKKPFLKNNIDEGYILKSFEKMVCENWINVAADRNQMLLRRKRTCDEPEML
jgi:hypothetical protein